jgi:hypothetical protein
VRHCRECRFEYERDMPRCPDCGAELKPGPLPAKEERVISPESEPVRLCRVADPSEADILRAALAEAGIVVTVRRHGPISGELGRVTDGMTEDYASVYVIRNRLEEARRVLEAIQSAEIEWPEGMEPDEGTDEEA